MGLFKLFSCGSILQRGGLSSMVSRVLTTSETEVKGKLQAKESSVVQEDGKGSQDSKDKKYAVMGVFKKEDGVLMLSDEAIGQDEVSAGKLSKELNRVADCMELGKTFVVQEVGDYSAVALTYYGPFLHKKAIKEHGYEYLLWGVGAGVQALLQLGASSIDIDGDVHNYVISRAAHLAIWQFNDFKSPVLTRPLAKLESSVKEYNRMWDSGVVHGMAENWVRSLSNTPANKMTPIDLAQAAVNVLCPLGVKVVAHDRAWIEAQRMEAFLAVARGSCEEPVFLECEWRHGDGPTVMIAAPGITFDCGGLCLKEHAHMMDNRESMAGAAAALGAMKAVAELEMELNVTMVIPLCENMISGQCMKVGDVVRALNGLNILIEDTDAAAHLMLADALVYGQATHRPEVVIDIAALTHGVQRAMAGRACGVFTNDETLWQCMSSAGFTCGNHTWRLPLWNYYHRRITNDPSVDLRSRGSGKASPCLGAAFLKNFVYGRWLHMDVTGVAKTGPHDPPFMASGHMSGRPVATLIWFLDSLSKKTQYELYVEENIE